MLEGLDERECDVLRSLAVRRCFNRGDVVFREGDQGRELFRIAMGTASVKLRLADGARGNRLATFSAGTMFGELRCSTRGRAPRASRRTRR